MRFYIPQQQAPNSPTRECDDISVISNAILVRQVDSYDTPTMYKYRKTTIIDINK